MTGRAQTRPAQPVRYEPRIRAVEGCSAEADASEDRFAEAGTLDVCASEDRA